ncbi:MAG: methylmalonyl-CoA mutase family protein [Chloroflexi bacterium]|nr:methylmalonyl-CoA mutase family protein [Chloroflexota bacterium]
MNLYDWRENGITAPQELAFGIGTAIVYVRKTIARGLSVDKFAPRLAFYLSSHVDFFEEIAKMRAARRLWARIMKEQFGARDPRSLHMRFGVHTAGCSLTAQQPLNNIVRIAYQALAAVLGGAQSLHCCSYDEPIALPTEMAQMLALRTQEILAYETGVANVGDPLGGSYYVESLTDRIEEEAAALLNQIEGMGGMAEAIRRGWVDQQIDEANLKEQRKVERSERLIVGLNVFEGEDEQDVPGGVHRLPEDLGPRLAESVRALRRSRDGAAVATALAHLRAEANLGEQHNLMPAIVEAVRVYATVGEIMGTIREACGYPYDPFESIETPA